MNMPSKPIKPDVEKSAIPLFIKKQEMVDYLRYLFKAPARGPIVINRNIDAGKYIYSRVSHSGLSAIRKKDEKTVYIILPDVKSGTDQMCHSYFPREDIDRINDFLQAQFNITFQAYMLAGEEMGVERKDLIEAFMTGVGIREVGKKFDTLKKKDYRHRKKIFNILVSSLQSIGIQANVG